MFKKLKAMKNKPFTWGDYFKLCKIGAVISVVLVAIEMVVIFRDEVKTVLRCIGEKIDLRKKIPGLHFEEDES